MSSGPLGNVSQKYFGQKFAEDLLYIECSSGGEAGDNCVKKQTKNKCAKILLTQDMHGLILRYNSNDAIEQVTAFFT